MIVKLICEQCGDVAEAKVAVPHGCQMASGRIVDTFLDDLQSRSGFVMNDHVRGIIRNEWSRLFDKIKNH